MAEPLLLGVVGVERDHRIRCQAPGCNHAVYKAIHLVDLDGKLQLYGSQCCGKLFGWTSKTRNASYTSTERRLTAEERLQLETNTVELIGKLKAEHEARLARLKEQDRVAEASRSVVGSARNRQPQKRSGLRSIVLSPEVERQAKEIVRLKYQVDPGLAGWRGLVLQAAKEIMNKD